MMQDLHHHQYDSPLLKPRLVPAEAQRQQTRGLVELLSAEAAPWGGSEAPESTAGPSIPEG